jgi:hypothetical protein
MRLDSGLLEGYRVRKEIGSMSYKENMALKGKNK